MVAAFGTIFNDIEIQKFDDSGNVTEDLHVPISYASKEKVLARIIDDPNISRQSATPPLPRISFEMMAPTYDANRALNPIQIAAMAANTASGQMLRQYEPVPYDYHFNLWVYAKTIEDGNKIVEQILPFFRPEFPLKVELVPQLNYEANIPVVLNTVSLEDTFDGKFDERRAIIWTFDFTMKGWLFGPIMNDAIIKFANVNFYAPAVANLATAVGNSTALDRVTVQPGLTANGQPTSNISLTIPYGQINATDPYGYIDTVYGDLNAFDGKPMSEVLFGWLPGFSWW